MQPHQSERGKEIKACLEGSVLIPSGRENLGSEDAVLNQHSASCQQTPPPALPDLCNFLASAPVSLGSTGFMERDLALQKGLADTQAMRYAWRWWEMRKPLSLRWL